MRNHLFLAALCLAFVAAPSWAASQRNRSTRSGAANKPAANGKSDAKSAAAEDPANGKVVEAGQTEKLSRGQIEFTPPEGWTKSDVNSNANRAAYVSPSREGMLLVEVPASMQIAAGTGDAVVKQLRGMRQKDGSKTQELKVEPDDRFDLRIVDRFTPKKGREASQLHLYKKVGPRVVMVTVKSVAEDADATKKIHTAGEDALLSAKYKGAPEKSTTAGKRGGTGTRSGTGGRTRGRTGT